MANRVYSIDKKTDLKTCGDAEMYAKAIKGVNCMEDTPTEDEKVEAKKGE